MVEVSALSGTQDWSLRLCLGLVSCWLGIQSTGPNALSREFDVAGIGDHRSTRANALGCQRVTQIVWL